MRLLLFSDLHSDAQAAKRIVEASERADLLIGAGDFGNVRRGIQDCIAILSKSSRPAILVPGNNESLEELTVACAAWPAATVLHGSGVEFGGLKFFGLGGGVPVTPFGPWSWDFTEAQAAKLLESCPRKAVLISHSPPKGSLDRSSSGQSLGSTAVLETVLRTRPRLVVCGHIHASGGQREQLDGIPVVNAGPAGMIEITLPL